MAVNKVPEINKKGKPLPHETEQSMKDTSLGLMNDIKMDETGHLKHSDTKKRPLPKDLI